MALKNPWGRVRDRLFFLDFEPGTIEPNVINKTGDLVESKEYCMVSAPNISSNVIASSSVQVPVPDFIAFSRFFSAVFSAILSKD